MILQDNKITTLNYCKGYQALGHVVNSDCDEHTQKQLSTIHLLADSFQTAVILLHSSKFLWSEIFVIHAVLP